MTATAEQMRAVYPFTEDEFKQANAEWGCNCGPSALAFALGTCLGVARLSIPDFDAKRYTSPSMMKAALAVLHVPFSSQPAPVVVDHMFAALRIALVRIQWTGKWTEPGANPRWAYRHTHWIASWRRAADGARLVFDCNGGVRTLASWEEEIVPILTAMESGRDGDWRPTHVWRLRDARLPEERQKS